MKFIFKLKHAWVLVILILLGQFDSKRHTKSRDAMNVFYSFGKGIVSEIANGVDFEKCLPFTWKKERKDTNEFHELEKKGNNLAELIISIKETLDNVKQKLNHSIFAFCSVKDLRNKAIDFYAKSSRRMLFFQIRSNRKRKSKIPNVMGGISLGDISAAAAAIKNGSVKATEKHNGRDIQTSNLASKDINYISDEIKHGLEKVLQPSVELLSTINPKLLGLLKATNNEDMIKFLGCLINLEGIQESNKNKVTKFIGKFSTLDGAKSWYDLIIHLICFEDDFKHLIEYLVNGASASGHDRWDFWGRFFGKFVYMLGY